MDRRSFFKTIMAGLAGLLCGKSSKGQVEAKDTLSFDGKDKYIEVHFPTEKNISYYTYHTYMWDETGYKLVDERTITIP